MNCKHEKFVNFGIKVQWCNKCGAVRKWVKENSIQKNLEWILPINVIFAENTIKPIFEIGDKVIINDENLPMLNNWECIIDGMQASSGAYIVRFDDNHRVTTVLYGNQLKKMLENF